MAKDIRYYLKFDSNGRQVMRELGVSTKELDRALEGVAQRGKETTGSLVNMASATVVIDGVSSAVNSLHAAMADLSAAYRVQIEAETKLETIMRQRMKATQAQIQGVKDLASAQQELGIIGDEVQLAGAQQLATFLSHVETLYTLIPAMNNLVAQQAGYAATSQNAISVANLMGKAMMGQASALRKVGITFDETQEKLIKNGDEATRAATLAQVITENVGEMNAALAATDTGKQKQLENTLGDIKEQIGALATGAMPFLTFGNQAMMAAGNVMKLANGVRSATAAVRALHIQEKLLAVQERNLAAIRRIDTTSIWKLSRAMQSIPGVAIKASKAIELATFAVRGFATAGIGAAIGGLIYLLDKLTTSTKKAKMALSSDDDITYRDANQLDREVKDLKEDDGTPEHERYDRLKSYREEINREYQALRRKNAERSRVGHKLGPVDQEEFNNRAKDFELEKAYKKALEEADLELKQKEAAAAASRKKAKGKGKKETVHYVGAWDDPEKFTELRQFDDADKQLATLEQAADPIRYETIRKQRAAIAKARAKYENRAKEAQAQELLTVDPTKFTSLEEFDEAQKLLSEVAKYADQETYMRLQQVLEKIEKARAKYENRAKEAKAQELLTVDPTKFTSLEEFDEAKKLLSEVAKYADQETYRRIQEVLENIEKARKDFVGEGQKRAMALLDADPTKFKTLEEFDEAQKLLAEVSDNVDHATYLRIKEVLEKIEKARKEFVGEVPTMALLNTDLASLKSVREFDELEQKLKELKELVNQQDYQKVERFEKKVANTKLSFTGTKEQPYKAAFEHISSAWSNIKGIKGGIDSMSKALDENASAWERLSGVIDGTLQLFQSITSITEMINNLTGVSTALTQADAAAKMESAAAAGAEATAETAAAAAKTASAHAKIPFVGIGIAMASIAALVALMTSLPKFAKGGIAYGPTLGLFGEYAGASNNPEVVAPLDRLRALIQPDVPKGELTTRITGRDIEVVYDYRKRKRSRI